MVVRFCKKKLFGWKWNNYKLRKNVVFNTSFVVIIRKYVVIITLVTCDTKAVSLVEQEVSCI